MGTQIDSLERGARCLAKVYDMGAAVCECMTTVYDDVQHTVYDRLTMIYYVRIIAIFLHSIYRYMSVREINDLIIKLTPKRTPRRGESSTILYDRNFHRLRLATSPG